MRMAASNPSREEAALAITGKPHDITQDVDAIQGVIAGAHAGIAAYRIAGESGLLVPETLKIAQLFKSHHEAHRDALAKLISDIGGSEERRVGKACVSTSSFRGSPYH